MTDTALLPCPFCGGKAKIVEGEESAYVQCVEMKMHRALWFAGDNAAANEVAEQWNRRVSPSQRPAVDVVEAQPNYSGWRSIDAAPEDCRVILATAGNWVGEAIMLRDEDTGEQVWTWVDTGKPSLFSCYGWKPLPEPLLAPVLSDLRSDGFDGPTGAE